MISNQSSVQEKSGIACGRNRERTSESVGLSRLECKDTRPTSDMTTSVIPLHTSTRPTVTAQRPHTLNLVNRSHCRAGWKGGTWPPLPPLPHHHCSNSSYNSNINIINNNNNNNNNNNSHHFNNNHTSLLSSTLHPMASMAQPLSTQTTSVDSIGSCSLDVNATGTTSPATLGEYVLSL
ncbi:rho GTPase-activating protein gacM-like [Penaeus indicus]|uniref:rho GTPase-activating protein gacM-like n=1 Tax=Penaeus indicus TaxID=29960 RepID=UPI00300CE034